MRILKIPALPDLSTPEILGRYGSNAKTFAGHALSRLLNSGNHNQQGDLTLRFSVSGLPDARTTLFTALGPALTSNDSHELSADQMLSAFYPNIRKVDEDQADAALAERPVIWQIHQPEEMQSLNHKDVYYLPRLIGNSENDGDDRIVLDDIFSQLSCPAVVDVCVHPICPKKEDVELMTEELRSLQIIASGASVERSIRGRIDHLSHGPDALARRHLRMLEQMIELVTSKACYRVVVLVASENVDEGERLAGCISQTLMGAGQLTATRVGRGSPEYQELFENMKTMSQPDAENNLALRSRLLGSSEVDVLARRDPMRLKRLRAISKYRWIYSSTNVARLLEIPTSEGVPMKTFSLSTDPPSRRGIEQIFIGTDIECGKAIGLSKQLLGRHVFISGAPGSGKTLTAFEILKGIWQ